MRNRRSRQLSVVSLSICVRGVKSLTLPAIVQVEPVMIDSVFAALKSVYAEYKNMMKFSSKLGALSV